MNYYGILALRDFESHLSQPPSFYIWGKCGIERRAPFIDIQQVNSYARLGPSLRKVVVALKPFLREKSENDINVQGNKRYHMG